jgi:release factor glutamine methyltransferase
MNVQHYLETSTAELREAGITSVRLDMLILLEDVLNIGRASILAHPEMALPDSKINVLNTYITQRKAHVPLAYIRGKAAFFGREFNVNEHVLVPRPETEGIIEILLKIPFTAPPRIADIGTGSGCVGITAGLEVPDSTVNIYDIDTEALAVARKNAQTYSVAVHATQQDLLTDTSEQFDVVLANLPYVPKKYAINKAATFEPTIALFSGDDGLDHYRTFWKQIANMDSQPSHVIIEAFPEQHAALRQLAATAGYNEKESEGFIQHFTLSDSTLEG